MGRSFSYDNSGFDGVKIGVKRETLVAWTEKRLHATVSWLKHKEQRLSKMLEDKKLTGATLKAMMRAGGNRGYSSNARGGVETDEVSQVLSLSARISELQQSREQLSDLLVGLKAAENTTIDISLATIIALQPADPENMGDDTGEDEEG